MADAQVKPNGGVSRFVQYSVPIIAMCAGFATGAEWPGGALGATLAAVYYIKKWDARALVMSGAFAFIVAAAIYDTETGADSLAAWQGYWMACAGIAVMVMEQYLCPVMRGPGNRMHIGSAGAAAPQGARGGRRYLRRDGHESRS